MRRIERMLEGLRGWREGAYGPTSRDCWDRGGNPVVAHAQRKCSCPRIRSIRVIRLGPPFLMLGSPVSTYVADARCTAAASNVIPSSLFRSDVAPTMTAHIPPCCATLTTCCCDARAISATP